jgi:hypothetical protein
LFAADQAGEQERISADPLESLCEQATVLPADGDL